MANHRHPIQSRDAGLSRISAMVLGLCAAITVALGVTAFILTIHRGRLQQQVEDKVAEIRAQGYPVTAEGLNAYYPAVPDEENAMLRLIQATNQYYDATQTNDPNLPIAGPALLPKPDEPLPKEIIAPIERHIEANGDYLEAVHEAAQLPKSRYPVDFGPEFQWHPDQYLRHIGLAIKIVWLEAVTAEMQDDAAKATASITEMVSLGEIYTPAPDIMAALEQGKLQYKGVYNVLLRALNHLQFSASQLKQLLHVFVRASESSSYFECFAAVRSLEIVRYKAGYGHFISAGEFQSWTGLPFAGLLIHPYRWAGGRELEFLNFLNAFDDMLALYDQPIAKRVVAAEQMRRSYADESAFGRMVEQTLIPAYLKVFSMEALGLALMRVSAAALAVELYRLEEGNLPASLDALVPDYLDFVPTDPFTGRPLLYKQEDGGGFVVYSVGMDMDDDGGIYPPDGMTYRQDGDVLFRVRGR